MTRWILAIAMVLSVQAHAEGSAQTIDDMGPYQLNGFEMTGAEYWIFVAGKPFKYPDDVLWGFKGEYANDGSKGEAPIATRECALVAFNKLQQFLSAPPSRFVELKEKGTTVRFFLWTNDYTQAAVGDHERPAQMWHWNSGTKDYAKGYWKWESTLTHEGKCIIPDDAQIAKKIEETHKALGN